MTLTKAPLHRRSSGPRAALFRMARLSLTLLFVMATLLAGSAARAGAGEALTGSVDVDAGAATYSLLTEPDQGLQPIYRLITSARRSVDLTMYELSDQMAEADLAADESRGVKVRVVLNRSRTEEKDEPAYNYLRAHHVAVRWAPTAYDLTHQKTLTVDGTVSVIMTLNMTSQYYSQTRDFAVIDRDRADVGAIEQVFNSDFAGLARSPEPAGTDLLWSPGADKPLVQLIASARHQLLVENEEMSEYTIVDALVAAAKRGVHVEVTMTDQTTWAANFDKLGRAGVDVRTYAPDASLYIHAKAIVVDPGTPDEKAEVGSQNFSWTSLEYNRELGIILGPRQAGTISSLATTLRHDFAGATAWSSTG